jgi:hypothetical protein
MSLDHKTHLNFQGDGLNYTKQCDELFKEDHQRPEKQKSNILVNLITFFMDFKVYLFTLLILCSVMVFYLPHYNNRLNEYKKHHEFLYSGMCDKLIDRYSNSNRSGKLAIINEIEILSARYKGTEMNCNSALLYVSMPKWLGAFGDWWKASFIHTIITGGNWKIQVVLAICALMIVYIGTKMIISLSWATMIGKKISPSAKNTLRVGNKRVAFVKKQN